MVYPRAIKDSKYGICHTGSCVSGEDRMELPLELHGSGGMWTKILYKTSASCLADFPQVPGALLSL